MERSTLLENALGVDLETMMASITATILATCTQELQSGVIMYYLGDNLIAQEYEENEVERVVWTPYGNLQIVEQLRERLKHIAMRLAVELI